MLIILNIIHIQYLIMKVKDILKSKPFQFAVILANLYALQDFYEEWQKDEIEWHDVVLIISSFLCLIENQ